MRRSGLFYGWYMVAGLSVTELVSWGVLIYAFSVFVVPMHIELGWSLGTLNAAYAVGIAVSGVVAMPVGRLLQARGARTLMTVGSVLTVLVLLGWSHVDSIAVFFGIFAVAGLAMAITLYEPAFAVTTAWFSAYRARAVLVLTVFGGLASVVFVPLTGWLIDILGWRDSLLVLAATVAVCCVPIHGLVLRRRPADLGLLPDGRRRERVDPVTARGDGSVARATAVRSASFRWFVLCMVAATASRVAISVILVAYLVDRGYPLGQASLLSGAVGLFQVCGRLLISWLRRYLPEHLASAILLCAQALALVVPMLTTGHGSGATVSIVVCVVLFGLGFGLPELLRGTLLAEYYGPRHFASINGTLAMFVIGARAGGPFLAGWVVTLVDSYLPVFLGAAFLAFVSAGALLASRRAVRTELGAP
ncbi:sugar phosphate permease [Tamaricihabitans halophyticus]|uniref:Sugar phosphate permease n=1 Tax=Tamaricihabitans halophyticus TaxID=1262583 RepID=A0A4R2QUJ0_9PSEU|nr:MFS transporter [Tamaricihabitans halophyticus]TCP53640.1 sugar phosphate permease [Tamaricihabitans halophyticus]